MTPTAIDSSVSTAPLLSVTPPRRTAGSAPTEGPNRSAEVGPEGT
jgi:hypothetical protein